MSEWLDAHARRRGGKRKSSAQADLFAPRAPRFEPPPCACGASACVGQDVFLRAGRYGVWKCFACARVAGWIS